MLLSSGAGAAAVAFMAGSAMAQTATWQGTVDTDWTNAANWSTGLAPTAANPFTFVTPSVATPQPIIDGGTGTVNTLYLGSVDGASLRMQEDLEARIAALEAARDGRG
jgi:hypothetical protein